MSNYEQLVVEAYRSLDRFNADPCIEWSIKLYEAEQKLEDAIENERDEFLKEELRKYDAKMAQDCLQEVPY